MEPSVVIGLGLAALMLILKLPLLGTPYYWDETLWIGFAHTLSQMPLWSALPGFDADFTFGNRPPGLFLPMAAVFKLTGPSIWLSHLGMVGFSALGVYFTVRLGMLWFGPWAGLLAGLFLVSNPLYFAQSGFFLADVPVTAMGVMTVYLGLTGRRRAYLVSAMGLLFLKETAAAVVFAFAAYRFLASSEGQLRRRLGSLALDAAPLLLMGGYYTWQKIATGYFFVHYPIEFEAFQFDLQQMRAQTWFLNRWLWTTQFKWIYWALVALALLIRPSFRRRELLLPALVLLCSGYSFSVLYFLPRYILPVAPFFFVAAAGAVFELARTSRRALAVGAVPIALALTTLGGRPLEGNGEWNLGHLRVVDGYRLIAQRLEADPPRGRVFAPFPLDRALSQPALGYVETPLETVHYNETEELAALEQGDLVIASTLGRPGSLRKLNDAMGLRPLYEFADGRLRIEVYGAERD